ncbi:MAG: 3-isopropylmalate dehydratase [Promethearchaeota archaeon]|nr:MAG: 3-isopropylmalate dehydratase [Candidatus Lokiarchaeota archaeon]
MKEIKGLAYVLDINNINTDDIVPSHCLTIRNPSEMAQYTCETIDSDFPQKAGRFNIIIAGENFGCGSSREEAVNVFKILGIKAIIAKSFARIYFRNLINQGIPAIVLEWEKSKFSEGDHLEISLGKGIIYNLSKDQEISFQEIPPFILNILEAGGIFNKIKSEL